MKSFIAKSRISIALLIICGWLMLMPGPLMASTGSDYPPVQLNLNGQYLYSDVDPVIVNGRTLVPLRVISEANQAEVEWDDNSRTVTVIGRNEAGEDLKITIQIGSAAAGIQKGALVQDQVLDVPAQIINNRTMVPVRFICETLGLSVYWDGENRIIYLSRSSEDSIPIQVTAKEVKYKNDWIDVNLQIPVISGLNNTAMQESLNNTLENDALQFKNPLEKDAEEYYQQAAGNEELHFWPYAAYTEFITVYDKNNLLSITVDYYDYTGGAHGYTERVAYNYDLVSGEEIKLNDLFMDSYDFKTILDQEVQRQIKQDLEIYFGDDLSSYQGINEDQPYYIEDDGLIVYFGLYEIAPYAAGIREFKVPFTLLEEGMQYQL